MVDIDSALTIPKENLLLENPFVTIILPLDYQNEKSPYEILDELIEDVKIKLKEVSAGPAFAQISKKLNRLIVKLPPQNLYKGLVAYLSEEVEDIIPVNYEVDKKAVVSNNFEFDSFEANFNSQDTYINSADLSIAPLDKADHYSGFSLFGKKTY